MGLFKFLFGAIRWVISIIVVAIIILFPIVVFDTKPLIFYEEMLRTMWELVKSQNIFSKLINIIK